MRTLRLWALVTSFAAAVIAVPHASYAADVLDPDLGTSITKAVTFDGKLWVLGALRGDKNKTSALVSFGLADGSRQLQFGDVIGIAKAPGHLWILRQTSDHSFVASEWVGGKFANDNELSLPSGDLPLALTLKGDLPVVVSRRSIHISTGKDWDATKLRGPLVEEIAWGFDAAGFSKSGNVLYIGLNRGEYGGGMMRIDTSSGDITRIESLDASKGGSGTLLSSKTDPVNAIIGDAQNPDCVIASVGMAHPKSSGRLVRVCGDTVRVVFDKISTAQQDGQTFDYNEAFFDLQPSGDGFWTISDGAIYRFHASGDPERIDYPNAGVWSGLRINRDRPDMIVLVTDMNSTMSPNGSTPLVVPVD